MRRGEDDEESVFIVADKVLRLQVEWMVQHAGVRKDFPVIVQKIWWSYLTVALPDVADGVEPVLLAEPLWMKRLREVDLACLLDVPQRIMYPLLISLEELAFPDTTVVGEKRDTHGRFKTQHTKLPPNASSRLAIDRLRHPRILTILILGLQVCGEHTLISDLLRWIRTLQFPYLRPPLAESEFASYSRINEGYPIPLPLYAEVEWLAAKLGKVMDLKSSDLPLVGLAPVVARFVEELNLPSAITGYTMGIARFVNTTQLQTEVNPGSFYGSWKRSRGVEAFAMACVVYAMRTLFGMDGESEMKISEATIVLRDLLGSQVKLFSFQEWAGLMDYRRLQLFRHTHLLPSCGVRADLHLADTEMGPLKENPIKKAEIWRLQRRLQDESAEEPQYPVVILPPTHRPFRAHTEALAKMYPQLSEDFSSHSIQHLFYDGVLPEGWAVSRKKRKQVMECLARIRGGQIAGRDCSPYRAQNWLGRASMHIEQEALMDEVPSFSMRWLLGVCGEIIEHSPERLLKQVLFLEFALFPHNVASKQLGYGVAAIRRMRGG